MGRLESGKGFEEREEVVLEVGDVLAELVDVLGKDLYRLFQKFGLVVGEYND